MFFNIIPFTYFDIPVTGTFRWENDIIMKKCRWC